MICPKCYNRGKTYSINGSISTVTPCDCEAAKEKQANFMKRMDKLKKELEQKLKVIT